MRELLLIGAVALMLLFFILAAQFESLRLPFIVLLEVPIAMAGALIMLLVFNATINVMSMIGLVVMSGIIINDSILKIDTINRLRAAGMPLMRALHTAGHYRLKPILMTSITTISALLPFLFITGLGGELQKPLALAVMGGLGLGTLVSLYFVPLTYYYLFRV
jgi:multidrug efflux pump subunit AcrB